MWQGRRDLIDTKQQQLSSIVNAYQALGGGWQVGLRAPALPAGQPLPPSPNVEAIAPPAKADDLLPPPN
jgi:hypothetical protein